MKPGIDASALAILAVERNRGYGTWPLPHERDFAIARLVEQLARQRPTSPPRSLLEPEHGQVLTAFAERMASLAVRTRSRDTLRLGLVAAGLAYPVYEWREVTLVMPLLWRSAQLKD